MGHWKHISLHKSPEKPDLILHIIETFSFPSGSKSVDFSTILFTSNLSVLFLNDNLTQNISEMSETLSIPQGAVTPASRDEFRTS